MNPEDQADLEAIFGKDALRAKAREISDRRAEGWARRKGSALPDMRKGAKAMPVTTRSAGQRDQWTGVLDAGSSAGRRSRGRRFPLRESAFPK